MEPDQIFGKMDPRKLGFNLREVFAEANQYNFNWRKQRRYDNRGSSANWNDDHEFATPKHASKILDTSNIVHENIVSKFSPF